MKFASSSFAAKLAVSLLMSSVLLGALVISASTPEAAGVRTKLACISDYRSYCSSYKMGSNELRQCMNANGPKLSRKCVKALVADGEISEAEVARRAADGRQNSETLLTGTDLGQLITNHQRREAITRGENGAMLVAIAKSFNVSHSTISRL